MPREVLRSASKAGAQRPCCPGLRPNGRTVRSGEQGVLFLSRRIACAAAADGGSNSYLQSVPCFLSFHGDNRNQVEMCVLCHNPSLTANPDDPNQLARGINFNLLIHRIHSAYKILLRRPLPGDEPAGRPGRHPQLRHVPRKRVADHAGWNQRCARSTGFINPVKPITSSCIGCHVTAAASSHALANTTTIGESCAVCHSSGSAFAVDKSHAQY